MKICLCFGGPSGERNISAGSLKPWVSWLGAAAEVELEVLFFDRLRRAWRLPEVYRYTNTCEDFESQLGRDAKLDPAALDELLCAQDVVVPLIHGEFGEDGELQRQLERLGVAYVFSAPAALALTMDKAACYAALEGAGLPVPQHIMFKRESWHAAPLELLASARSLTADESEDEVCLAVKPLRGGSSLGVTLCSTRADDFGAAVALALDYDEVVLVEALIEGEEFSVIVLEGDAGPIALAPTEVEKQGQTYDTRSKYLHGEGARLHTPLRRTEAIEGVRAAALEAWRVTGLRDMARIDGFLQPDGRVIVTDVNGISGMGFSSFGFLQTSMCGLSHADLITSLIERAARRGRREVTALASACGTGPRVHVVLGGPTSERQVSRQSGIFVGLSLLSRGFDVRFVLMDQGSHFTEIGLFFALHHDVEEIQALVEAPAERARIEAIASRVGAELGFDARRSRRHLFVGETTDLSGAVEQADFVFLALHGGPGEDGRLQAALEVLGKAYNGCGAQSSHLCSDKVLAIEHIAERCLQAGSASLEGVATPQQHEVSLGELTSWIHAGEWRTRFASLREQLGSSRIVGKPAADGCSTGVKLLSDSTELEGFVRAIVTMTPELAPGALAPGSRALKLPVPAPDRWVFERALVDEQEVRLPSGDLNAENLRGWIASRQFLELTCAVLEDPESGELRAAIPSLTIATSGELSLEEKFQQGVGTNLELDAFLSPVLVRTLRARVSSIAAALGIEGYARIDCFYDQHADLLYFLEANTLCGLTEATVFYSQASSSFGASPPEALEWILRAGRRRARPAPIPGQACSGESTRTAMTSMPAR